MRPLWVLNWSFYPLDAKVILIKLVWFAFKRSQHLSCVVFDEHVGIEVCTYIYSTLVQVMSIIRCDPHSNIEWAIATLLGHGVHHKLQATLVNS
jgi:hypothetical protein